MAGEQRKLAHASKRDSSAMKTISLLGAIFLPGAFLASIFSTTFFQFQFPSPTTIVSSDFYIFWACTIPLTLIVMFLWYIWESRRDRRYKAEDEDLERGVDTMEADIMATMRQRTMSKVSTWNEKTKGVVMQQPSGGIHFPGSHKVNKRADALTEENMVNVNGNGVATGGAKAKVRIAEKDREKEG